MSEIEFSPASPGEFNIGDKVRVVLEGTLTGYGREDGHYYLKGASWDADGLQHVPWLYNLHWATEFHVLEAGPGGIGDGATNAEDAFAVETKETA